MKRRDIFEISIFGAPAAIAVWALLLMAVIILGASTLRILRPDPRQGLGAVMAPLPDGREVPCVIARDTNALALTCDWNPRGAAGE